MLNSEQQAPMSLDNIRPVLKRVLDLRMDKKDIEKELKELEATVRPVIEGKGKLQLDNYICECKQMAGRKVLKKDALNEFLKQHGKSIEDFEELGKPYTVLRVDEANTIV